jgi:glycerol-3-phosphate dehydrogenase
MWSSAASACRCATSCSWVPRTAARSSPCRAARPSTWARPTPPWSEGHTAWPGIDPADVSYLLAPLHRQLAARGLGPLDVFAAWAGLRPLVAEPGKPPTEISRKDEVTIGPVGVVSIAGGKLTGYLPMAQATLEGAAAHAGLALPPHRVPESLPGGEGAEDLEALARSLVGVPASVAARLARAYGGEARAVLARGADLLVPGASLVEGEVDWAVDVEDALRLEDVLYRRTGAALYDPVGREALLAPVAEPMARKLGWSGARRASEVAAVRERLVEDLAFKDHSNGAADPASGSEERA